MCGIVGVAKLEGLSQNHRHFFAEALYADALRGEDSTGIYLVHKSKNKKNKTIKQAMHSFDLLCNKRFSSKMNPCFDYKVFLGHNRAATKGAVDNDNAHPFTHGNITMVHNGTLRNEYKLPYWKNAECNVDSDALCHAINEWGIDEVVKTVDGAYALVWVDLEKNTLNFLRNKERPLSFAYSSRDKCLVWASEGKMLDWLAHRNKVELDEVIDVAPNYLFSYDLGAKTIEPPKARELEVYVKPDYSHYNYKNHMYGGNCGKKSETVRHIGTKSNKNTQTTGGTRSGYKKPPEDFPKHGEVIEVWADTGERLPSGRLEVSAFTYDDKAYDCRIFSADEEIYEGEGVYKVKILNVIWEAQEQSHVAMCKFEDLIEKFDDKSTDKKEEQKSRELDGDYDDILSRGKALVVREPCGIPDDDLPFDPDSVDPMLVGPGGLYVPRKEWLQLVKNGCSSCTADLCFTPAKDIYWMDGREPICPSCQSDEEIQEELGFVIN